MYFLSESKPKKASKEDKKTEDKKESNTTEKMEFQKKEI